MDLRRTLLWITACAGMSPGAFGQSKEECFFLGPKAWYHGECEQAVNAVVHKMRTEPEGYRHYRFRTEDGQNIGNDLWGLVQNDTLFLNADGKWFIPVLEQGLVCYFKGPPYVSPGEQQAIQNNYLLFGSIMGSVATGDIYAQARDRIHYVLDTRTERIYLLGTGRMRILLAEHPRLLAEFEREAQPPGLEVMLSYIRRLNAEAE